VSTVTRHAIKLTTPMERSLTAFVHKPLMISAMESSAEH